MIRDFPTIRLPSGSSILAIAALLLMLPSIAPALAETRTNGAELLKLCDRPDRTACRLVVSGFLDGLEYVQGRVSVAGDPRHPFSECIVRNSDEQVSRLVEWLRSNTASWDLPNGDLLFSGLCR